MAFQSHLASVIEEKLGVFKTNTFYHQPQLAKAVFNDINRPNVDTYVPFFESYPINSNAIISLYSEALVDVLVQDLIVIIPDNFPADRFHVFPFYDA